MGGLDKDLKISVYGVLSCGRVGVCYDGRLGE